MDFAGVLCSKEEQEKSNAQPELVNIEIPAALPNTGLGLVMNALGESLSDFQRVNNMCN